jgi:hypothetical protein
MIDWNGDGKVDPIETGLTFQLMQEEQDRRRGNPGGSGCLTAVMTFVIVISGAGLAAASTVILFPRSIRELEKKTMQTDKENEKCVTAIL